MTFKKYSIKSHYKVDKLVLIIKLSHLKNVSDKLNTNKASSGIWGQNYVGQNKKS
jgi:hypothetical protein